MTISENLRITAKRTNRQPVRFEEARMVDSPAEVYDDLKSRIKGLGMELRAFAGFIGLSETTMPKWRSIGTPPYAVNVLKMLETYTVRPSWRASRAKPAPTLDDARTAMRPALTAVVDDAISKGWSRDQIADVLRQIAGQTDGAGTA